MVCHSKLLISTLPEASWLLLCLMMCSVYMSETGRKCGKMAETESSRCEQQQQSIGRHACQQQHVSAAVGPAVQRSVVAHHHVCTL